MSSRTQPPIDASDARALLTALRDLLASAQGLVQHLLVLRDVDGGRRARANPDSIVTPVPRARLALPARVAVAPPEREERAERAERGERPIATKTGGAPRRASKRRR